MPWEARRNPDHLGQLEPLQFREVCSPGAGGGCQHRPPGGAGAPAAGGGGTPAGSPHRGGGASAGGRGAPGAAPGRAPAAGGEQRRGEAAQLHGRAEKIDPTRV